MKQRKPGSEAGHESGGEEKAPYKRKKQLQHGNINSSDRHLKTNQ